MIKLESIRKVKSIGDDVVHPETGGCVAAICGRKNSENIAVIEGVVAVAHEYRACDAITETFWKAA